MKGVSGGLGRVIEAWKQLTADGRYRLANENDFSFSEAARGTTIDIQRWVKHPFRINDINDDYVSRDLAVVIVDTTRTNPERFALVIFNAPADTDKETVPQPHWVYRERDLSTGFLGYSRDGLEVRSYKEDGTFTLCHVRWNKTKKEYGCKYD